MAWMRTQGLLNTAGLPCPVLCSSCLTPDLSSSPLPTVPLGQREGQETALGSPQVRLSSSMLDPTLEILYSLWPQLLGKLPVYPTVYRTLCVPGIKWSSWKPFLMSLSQPCEAGARPPFCSGGNCAQG